MLLLTPSQLFRSYSAELMRRFRLTSIANTSVAELYRALLFKIDDRFKNRQYRYELSEEYLPDEYLNQVYSREMIDRIRAEIKRAIRTYVDDACSYLNIPVLEEPYSHNSIESLVERLDKDIEAVSLREKERSKDDTYLQMKKEYESQEKTIAAQKRIQERQIHRRTELQEKKDKLTKLRDDIDIAESELAAWLDGISTRNDMLHSNLLTLVQKLDKSKAARISLGVLNDYLAKAAAYLDATCEWGVQYKEDAEQTTFLRSYIELCQQELDDFTKTKSANALERSIQRDIDENEKRIQTSSDTISQAENRIEEIVSFLQEYTKDADVRNQTKARIDAMEASRYFLSRIESTVFEREIWNVLAPLKTKCGIETIDIEDLGNGRRRETRILYKSDLLFYLRIYMYLNETGNIPMYDYICVDEGQDLHAADYETLQELYPNAVFTVFGDLDQALHVNCGISNWQEETGIQQVFELNKNYRNTPAVVEFIKRQFGAHMEACGSVKKEQEPGVLRTKRELVSLIKKNPDMAVIVKDRKAFDALREYIGDKTVQLNYIDTNSAEEADEGFSCYSVFAAKGLEYPDVLVWPNDMTVNQKVVACSRALNHLYYCDQ